MATPTGQVLRWHLRIIVQPKTIKGAVLNPISSAPNKAATTTSKPKRPINEPKTKTMLRGFSTGSDLAVGLQDNPGSEVVQDQNLVRLRDSKFPGKSRAFDAGPGAGSCAAIVAGNHDVFRFAFRHS